MNERTLLAVDPGSRELGVAVLRGTELWYYAVKGIARGSLEATEAEAERVIRSLISEHRPFRFILLRRIVIHQPAERLAHVTRRIRRTALDEGLALFERSPQVVRQFICGEERATKAETVKRLAAHYPELRQYAEGRTPAETHYYERMFGAIGAGLMCALESNH